MASWFTRALDRITPWDRGGEAQRRREEEERRRREAEARRQAQAPRPQTPTPSRPPQQAVRVQQAQNNLPRAASINELSNVSNSVPVVSNYDSVKLDAPKPGTVVRPIKGQVSRDAIDSAYRSIKSGQTGAPLSPDAIKGAQVRIQHEEKRAEQQRKKERAARIAKQSVGDKARNTVASTVASAARLGAGNIQAAGGLFDWATRRDTPSAISRLGNRYAEKIDDIVEKGDLNTKLYRGAQVGGEIGQGLGAGVVARQLVRHIPKLASLSSKADDVINRIPGKGKTGDAVRATARELKSPEAIGAEAYFANKSIGEASARGEDITPGRVALEYGLALPGAAGTVAVNRLINRFAPAATGALPSRTATQTPSPSDAPNVLRRLMDDQRGYVQVGPTPKRIHREDQGVLADFVDMQRGRYNPDPKTRHELEIDVARIAERYGITPSGNKRLSPEARLAQAIDDRLMKEGFGKPDPTDKKPGVLERLKRSERGGAPLDADKSPIARKLSDGEVPDPNKTVLPKDLPETPGQVRATTTTDPQAAKTQLAAEQMAAAPVHRGTAKTGEVGQSKGKYARGQEYEKTSREANRLQGEQDAANTSYQDFLDSVDTNATVTATDRNTALALQKRFKSGSPEHKVLGEVANKSGTDAAQALATIDRAIRRTASSEQLTNKYTNKFYSRADDGAQLSDADFAKLDEVNNAFTKARDDYSAALDKALKDPSKQNVESFVAAMNRASDADKAAKFAEYDIAANKAGKGEKANKFIREAEQKAGVYTMDWVDSSMLSSTRVMINNYFNTLGVRLEEQAFGKLGARIGSKLASALHKTDVTVGGGNRTGRKLGRQRGWESTKSDARLRRDAHGNAFVKGVKNITTTGNTLGERNIQDAVYGATYDHYRQGLKKAGYSGKELENRTLIQTLTDPDKLADANNPKSYMHQALVDNSLASMFFGRKYVKIETDVANRIQDILGGGKVARNVAKGIMRVTIGFPTVVARAGIGGTKRAAFGGISTLRAFNNVARKGDPADTARYFKQAVKEAGSGAVMMSMGAALYANGRITGAYPKDKDEQAEWQREGKREYAIKIGSDWWDLPAALGVFAIPTFIGANSMKNVTEGKPITDDFVGNAVGTIINAMPVDSVTNLPNFLQQLERGRDVSKEAAGFAASGVRAATPLGSFVNQLAKAFDPTANDTTKGDLFAQFTARVMDGIPGLANTLPSREVDGNEIRNPSLPSRMLGAVSTEQSGGVQKTQDIRDNINESVRNMNDYGVFSDNIRNILDDEKKSLFDKAKAGEELGETELRNLSNDIVRGVTSKSDTHFLEKGDYDSNLAALKLKRDLYSADPTAKQSTIDEYDVAVKRGEVYKEAKLPYEDITAYKSVGLEDWRKMGDPDSEGYDPDMYEKLWQIDQMMTEAGVSYGKGLDKNKYYQKPEGKGRGRKASGTSGGIGKLTAGAFAPKVQEYQGIQSRTAPMPIIQRVRPNIHHKITVSR